MPSIRVREHEPFDTALRRFKRVCEKAGVTSEARRHEFYEKPTWKRKRKAAQARKRWMKKIARSVMLPVRGVQGRPKRKSRRSFSRG